MTLTRRAFTAAAAFIGAATLGVSSFASVKLPTNEKIVVAATQEFDYLNPITSSMSMTAYIHGMVQRARMTVLSAEDNKYYTVLATKIPTPENGGVEFFEEKGVKKMKVHWEIKPEAKWGDGTDITGHDYAFNIKVGKSNNVQVPEKKSYTDIDKVVVDAKNPKKFTVHYKTLKWDYYQAIPSNHLIPKHIEGKIFEANKDKVGAYEKASQYVTNPDNPGLYYGPYVVSEVKLGSHVIVKPNKNWHGKKPNIKQIVVRIVPETSTVTAGVQTGAIHVVPAIGTGFDWGISLEKTVKQKNLPYVVGFKSGTVYEHLDINHDNEHLKNLKVRRAISHAIDKKTLTKTLFNGKQQAADHNIHPSDPWYTDDKKYVTTYRYSPRKAKKLLKEAGYKYNRKDKYFYKDGKKLSLYIGTTSGNSTRENVQQYIQNALKNVGIELNIENQPAKVFFGETCTKRKFKGFAMFAWVSAPESDSFDSTFASTSIPSKENGWSGNNFGGWENDFVDKMSQQISKEMDAEQRKKLVHQFIKAYTDDVGVIPLYYRANVTVTPSNMTGITISSHQYHETYHVEKWNLDTRTSKK